MINILNLGKEIVSISYIISVPIIFLASQGKASYVGVGMLQFKMLYFYFGGFGYTKLYIKL